MSFAWREGDPFYNNDAPKHLLTGAFWADFLTELPLSDPAGFAETYYAHYPALGIIHWPPAFHLIEGATFAVLGVSQPAAGLLMTAFVAVILVGWFLATYRLVGVGVALWSALLFPLAPDFFDLAGQTMLAVPTLAWCVLSVLTFERFLRTGRSRWLWIGAACACAAALTRPQGVIVLGPLLACWLASRRWDMLRRKSFWSACAAGLVLVGTYYALTLPRTSGWSSMLAGSQEVAWDDVGWPTVRAMGPVVTACAFFGLAWIAVRLLRRRSVPWVLVGWIAATVGIWLAVSYRPTRFLIYAWPPLTTLGLCAVADVLRGLRLRSAYHPIAAAALAVGCFTLSANARPPLGGYRDAAVAALQLTDTDRIFFHGRMDATFLWHARQLSPELDTTVFRASKVLAGGEDRLHKNYEPYAVTVEEIVRTLDGLGVDLVVTEDLPEMEQPTFHNFLRALKTQRFRQIAVFPLRQAEGRIFARRLTLYRFRRTQPLEDRVSIPMVTLGPGHELHVDLSHPLRGWSQN